MKITEYEAMSATERHSLDLSRLGFALGEIEAAIITAAQDEISALLRLSEIRIAWREQDGTFPDHTAYDTAVDRAKTAQDILKIRVRTLNRLHSGLQTKIRGIQ